MQGFVETDRAVRAIPVGWSCDQAADVVILAGSIGLEESWTGGTPRALLPLPGSSVLRQLITRLAEGARRCIVCANSGVDEYRRHVSAVAELQERVEFQQDSLPRGTAGCLKDCQSRLNGGPILVAGASVWLEDDPRWMIEQHKASGNALTIFCIPHQVWAGVSAETRLRPAGVYCCDPAILEHIAPAGYQDIKEQLVPRLQAAGLRVGAVPLRGQTYPVADWPTYLHAVTRYLAPEQFAGEGYEAMAPTIWRGRDVYIAPDARVVGPTLLGHGVRVESGAVVVGPTVLGTHCRVGERSWVVRTIAPKGTVVPADSSLCDQLVPAADMALESSAGPARRRRRTARNAGFPAPVSAAGRGGRISMVTFGATLAVAFVWAFWSNLAELWFTWQTNADYGAGQLVPLAAAYMVYSNRKSWEGLRLTISSAGLGLFCLGWTLNLAGSYLLFSSISNLGMVVCIWGLFMTLFGWHGFRRLLYPLLFLVLMLPLPNRVHDAIMIPLQSFGAQAGATILEIVGIPVERFGNVLEVAGQRVAVAEACNGLRMAMAFLIVTGLVAYIIRRPMWQRVTVLISSIPIALACNVARIVVTAYLYSVGYDWLAQGVFHDGAGLLMMPLALSMILLELWLLSNLAVPPSVDVEAGDRVEKAVLAETA